MSYVAPHLRNNKKETYKVSPPKAAPKAEKVKVNDFPELVKTTKTAPQKPASTKPAMDFSKLFNIVEEVVEKKDELKRGIIKLTNNGIVDSLTPDEREQDDAKRNNWVVTNNMINYYNKINKQREQRCMTDTNYSPEVVIDEYSSSDSYYSTEESEYAEDDPEQETVEF